MGGSPPGDPNAAYGASGPWDENQAYTAPGTQPYWGQGYVQTRTDPMAGWGLGLAIVGLFCGITGPVGLGLGIASLNRQKRQPMVYSGRGLAIAAIVIGSLTTALYALQLVFTLTNGGNGLYGY